MQPTTRPTQHVREFGPSPLPPAPSCHRLRRVWSGFSLLLAALALVGVAAPSAQAAGLLVADGGFGGVLEIEEHAATVTINNGIAVTEIEQTFVNTENRIVEALYIFPVPKGASVANFSMWIDGREMVGEVVEKERAREIYESYKQTRRDPGLLEQVDYKTFEMRIFPIAAGARQRIRLSYYQELDVDHNWASYTYPLATVARSGLDEQTTGRFAMTLRVKSEVPIVEMTSPSHNDDFVVSRHSDHFYEASLETRGGSLANDLVIDYKLARPRTGLDLIASRPEGEDGYFLMTLTPGEELASFDQPMDYVFVLDISGSMAHDQKLALSTRSIGAFVDQLGPNDRFELLAFNVQPTTLFNELQSADDANKAGAQQFLEGQQARGGTALAPALTTAYRYGNPDRPLNVVILSDGMTEQGERTELLRLIGQRPAHARVFTIGVGNEVDRPLLQQLAEDAGGLAAFISRGADFDRQAQAFRRKLTRPVATDVKITINGVDAYDVVPGELPNLYHGAPLRLYGRYKAGSEANVTLAANILGQPITRTVAMSFPQGDAGNPEIERMWAWHRVQELLADADRSGSRSGAIDQVVRLGETYSIVTEYTSFIVLENDAEYQRWRIERRNALRLARDRTSQEQLNRELDRLRQQATQALGPVPDATSSAADKDESEMVRVASRPSDAQPAQRDRSRGVDLPFPTGGGGAFDPFSVSLIAGLGAAAVVAGRRRKNCG